MCRQPKLQTGPLSGAYFVDRAAQKVQATLGPPPGINNVDRSIRNAKGRIQKLQLFIRGSAISGAPIISGIIQLANPTNAGMIAPNTMTKPRMVVSWLKKLGTTSGKRGTAK